jgi:hypothetical protein
MRKPNSFCDARVEETGGQPDNTFYWLMVQDVLGPLDLLIKRYYNT